MATADIKPSGKRAAKRAAGAPAPKRRRWFRPAFWMPMILATATLGLAPTIASYTPLGDWLVNRFVPVNGRIDIGSLSVGWFAPVSAADVSLFDEQGGTVAQVAAASADRTLLQLLLDHSDLGQIELDQPQLHAVLRDTGSNLEDVLAPLLTGGSSSGPVKLSLKITGGSALVEDQFTGRKYQIDGVTADVGWDGFSHEPLSAQASAKLTDANRAADLSLVLKTQGSEDGEDLLGAGQLTCQVDRLPLDVAEPLVRRRLAGAQLAGALSARFDASWGGGAAHDEVSIQGQVEAADLLFTAAALGHDRIEMARLSAPCQIVGTSQNVRIDKLLLDCDLGQVAISGQANLADFAGGVSLATLARQPCQIAGKLDLVRLALAALLPDTLRVRPGTQITAGQLNVSLASQPAGGTGMSWTGRVDTSDLEAVSDGNQYKWQQPLAVQFQAHESPTGPVIDKLNCDSSFLHVEGSGTLDQLTAGASFDLNQLAAELAQFIDLGRTQLAGTGQVQLTWQRDADGRMQSQADITARDFSLAAPNRPAWHEANLTAHVEAAGAMSGGQLVHLDALSGRLEASDEHLSLQLLQPVDDPLNRPLPIQIDWQGELAGLIPRAEIWLGAGSAALAGWDISGAGNLQMLAQASTSQVDVEQCKLIVQRLHAWGHGLYLDEAAAQLDATASFERAGNKLNVPLATLRTATAIARINNLQCSAPDGAAPRAAGNATLEGNLSAVTRWLHDPRQPPAHQVAGQLAGQVELTLADGSARAALNATIDQLQVAGLSAPPPAQAPATLLGPAAPAPQATAWQEPRLTVAARVDYDQARDELSISQGEIAGQHVQAQINGRIASALTQPNVELSGQLLCNWEQLAALWQPYTGQAVKIVGREPWPFTLRGPWTEGTTPVLAGAQRMQGEASIRWLSASVYGLDVGSGTLDARLADGTFSLQPVNVAIAGGQLHLAPLMHLAAQPAQIELPAGPMLTNVNLSQEVCAHALKFIAPIFAEVTRTDGQFSMTLLGGRLPLADPSAGDLAGQMQIHSVEMRPGPILQTLVGFGAQVEGILQGKVPFANPTHAVALVRIENQNVDFRLVDRRVYHRGLQFTAGNVTITTRGSVGLDETIAVMAEIPLRPGQLGPDGTPDGQTLQFPIGGTLKNPHIDPKALEQLPKLLIKGTGKVLNRLEGAIEKLVPGQNP